MSIYTPTWPKIINPLTTTTAEFGGEWGNLVSDYMNGINIGLLDPTKKPKIGTPTTWKFETLGLLDNDESHKVSFSVDDIDSGVDRLIKIRRMNSPNTTDYMMMENLPQEMKSKTVDADLNFISNIDNADIKVGAGITDNKLAQITDKAKLPSVTVYTDQANTFGDSVEQRFKHQRLTIRNPANTFSYQFNTSAITANRTVTYPALDADDIPLFQAFSQPLSNKTINPTNNTIPFLNSYVYTIYQDGGAVKVRNNLTGAVTSNANLDPLVTTILASGNPSFEVQRGTYTLSSGFAGWTVPSSSRIYFDTGCIITVPNAYASYCFLFTANSQYSNLEGGYWNEAGSPSSNWYIVEMFPDMSPSEEGVLHNRIAHMTAYQAKAPIHLKTDTTSWINSNVFENIFANRCKYLVFKEHVNAFTALASGMNVNTFINCRMQSQPSIPQALGGIVGVDGDANNFINCSVWDLQAANASARSLDISANARYTKVDGGYLASYNIQDLGKWTEFHDKYVGLTSHKLGITAVEATGAGSNETLATFKVRDDTSNFFQIENGTVTDALYLPQFRYKQYTANNFARIDVHDVATSFDTGTTPFYLIDFRKNNASAITSTTKPLLRLGNFATGEFDFYIDRLDMKNNSIVNLTLDADGTGNSITNIENADIKAAAGIITSKLADSANFLLKTLDNSFGAHYFDMTRMTAPSNPASNDGRFYVKQIDSNNDGFFCKIKKGGSFVELQIL